FNLSFMSWRGFNPSTLPVSIAYSDMIADLFGTSVPREGLESRNACHGAQGEEVVPLNQDLFLQPALDRLRGAVLEQNSPGSVEGLLAHHILKDDPRIHVDWQVLCTPDWVVLRSSSPRT